MVAMASVRLVLGLGLFLSLTKCGPKVEDPVLTPVGFLPAVTLTPSARTIRRGDTLWLEARYSDSLLDYHSGRRHRVRPQDLDLRSFLVFRELLGVGQEPVGIAPTFRLVEQVGRASVSGSLSGRLELVYDGVRYRARIGLIPTKACVTSITLTMSPAGSTREALGQALPFIALPPDAQGREQKAVLDDSFYSINDGKANNFDLFAQHTRAFALEPGTMEKQKLFEQKSTFTVEVQ